MILSQIIFGYSKNFKFSKVQKRQNLLLGPFKTTSWLLQSSQMASVLYQSPYNLEYDVEELDNGTTLQVYTLG